MGMEGNMASGSPNGDLGRSPQRDQGAEPLGPGSRGLALPPLKLKAFFPFSYQKLTKNLRV